MMRTRYLLAGLLALVLAACSSGATPAPSVETSAQPPDAPASPSPQAVEATAPSLVPTPTTEVLEVKVTFDGETCTYIGPSVIPDGTVMKFEYAPDQEVAGSWLFVYGVEPGTTIEDAQEFHGDQYDAPVWVQRGTAYFFQGAGTMLYSIANVQTGRDLVEYTVGGYQVACSTPTLYVAAQLSVG